MVVSSFHTHLASAMRAKTIPKESENEPPFNPSMEIDALCLDCSTRVLLPSNPNHRNNVVRDGTRAVSSRTFGFIAFRSASNDHINESTRSKSGRNLVRKQRPLGPERSSVSRIAAFEGSERTPRWTSDPRQDRWEEYSFARWISSSFADPVSSRYPRERAPSLEPLEREKNETWFVAFLRAFLSIQSASPSPFRNVEQQRRSKSMRTSSKEGSRFASVASRLNRRNLRKEDRRRVQMERIARA